VSNTLLYVMASEGVWGEGGEGGSLVVTAIFRNCFGDWRWTLAAKNKEESKIVNVP
jgi:hypothetical protein